ncbi:MAG: DUF4835 family protein [Chitinophagaceae bacterium]|jgi:Domain of unknown function (DUF4835)|nr:DUF4835 family protein [Sediminibacterium sp.]
MRYKQFVFAFFVFLTCTSVQGQELAATVNVQTNKIENQVDPKIFIQFQKQLKDFINQRKWTNDVFAIEEKIDCGFYINIESIVSPGVYEAKLSIVANRPVLNANYTSPLLTMQDANFVFKYQLGQPMEFNENRAQGADPLEANLISVIAYYVNIIIGLDYDSFAPKAGMPYFNKALNIVYNSPEGSGISGWKSYDGQRNRYIFVDNLTKSGFDKLHEVIYAYNREGLDQMSDKPGIARAAILNALMAMQELNDVNVNSMAVPILMQGKFTEIVGIFETADKPMKKQLLNTLASIDIANINRYKEKLE